MAAATREDRLREWADQVRGQRLSRRAFVDRVATLGLSAPMAGMMLMEAGVAEAGSAFVYKPTRRGGGGTLRIMAWDAPTLLNPHFATGRKDIAAARIFYEPLAQWDAEGTLERVLAAEIPSRANGGLAADGRSVVWRLKRNVTWHDGHPFTADDVIFNWRYAIDPATASTTAGSYARLRMEKLDDFSVRVVFDAPAPFWPGQYSQVLLVPAHRFAAFAGNRSRQAPNNDRPVGTGAYTFVEFRPADLLLANANPSYHLPDRPHFDRLELKGGGDPTSAARAVLQTGEYDYTEIVVEDEVLQHMEAAGKGRVEFLSGSNTVAIFLNRADPGTEVDGERANPKSSHPLFSDPSVRRALGLLVDRRGIQTHLYGRQGRATGNFLNNPVRYRSTKAMPEFDVDKAAATLEAGGWKLGADGVRRLGDRRLSLLFQAGLGAVPQKLQAIVKQAARRAGIEMEIKAVVSSVYFSSDVANPDTFGKFYADMQTCSWIHDSPDPAGLMQAFVSWEVASKANKWQGANVLRWQNAGFDALYRAAETELDPFRRAELFIRMNDLVVSDGYVLPIVDRASARALKHGLMAPLSSWQNDMASLPHWYRDSR